MMQFHNFLLQLTVFLALCLIGASHTKPLIDDLSYTTFDVVSLHGKTSEVNDFESPFHRKRSADPAGVKVIWEGLKETVKEAKRNGRLGNLIKDVALLPIRIPISLKGLKVALFHVMKNIYYEEETFCSHSLQIVYPFREFRPSNMICNVDNVCLLYLLLCAFSNLQCSERRDIYKTSAILGMQRFLNNRPGKKEMNICKN